MTLEPLEEHPWAERLNSITHGVGWALAIAALVVMVVFSAIHGSARHVVGTAIFGSTMVLLYAMSTLYHAFKGPRVKKVFRILDHAAIYLLIAGTYTPFCLTVLRGGWGWSLFGVTWGLAVLGIVFKSVFGPRFEILSVSIYLAMGWLALVAILPLWRALPPGVWPGSSAVASSTAWAPSSTPGNACPSIMPSGTCSCSPAAPVTSWP